MLKHKSPPGVSEVGFGGLDLELEWGKLEEEWEELAGVGRVLVEILLEELELQRLVLEGLDHDMHFQMLLLQLAPFCSCGLGGKPYALFQL